MKRLAILASVLCLALLLSTAQAQFPLKVDFSSTTQDGGPHPQAGWSEYNAGHEVAADFDTKTYGGISITPAWPNTTDNRVQQMIDRGTGNDDNWDNTAGDIDLVTDFLGIDTRTGNGGNGDWDGTTGTPTYMTLAIGGLAAGGYNWISFHQDTEHCHGIFRVELSTDGGVTYTQLADGLMTDSTPGGTPDSAIDGSYGLVVGPDAYTIPSTYRTSFSANGTDDVVLRFALYSGVLLHTTGETAVHNQIWAINGFVLEFWDKANTQDPAHGETGVLRDLSDRTIPNNLSWLAPDNPGITQILSYDLYLDPNATKVADRDGTCLIVQPGLANTVTQYDPADFDWSETYYWVVDTNYKKGGPSDPNVYKGAIDPPWNFTTIGAGPEVDAGSDLVTALPLLPANLAGTITDATNDVASVEWEVVRYPGDPVNVVAQMYDRGTLFSVDPDILRDWIGTDNRQPGNPLILTLSGLPAGSYNWTSIHHDTDNQTGLFNATILDSTGSTTTTDIDISDELLTDPNNYTKFMTTIVSDGSDVRLVFYQQASAPTVEAFFVMNGFDLVGTGDPLMIDFGRTTSPVKTGYQAYTATHEVLSTFTPQAFSAFGATVTISVDWGPKALGLINASVTKTNADLYAPTADFTADTVGTYEVQLTATDSENNVTSDSLQISVAEDACAAAQNDPLWDGFNYYDRDEDCDVDMFDFADFALEWLDDRNLTGQVNNP